MSRDPGLRRSYPWISGLLLRRFCINSKKPQNATSAMRKSKNIVVSELEFGNCGSM